MYEKKLLQAEDGPSHGDCEWPIRQAHSFRSLSSRVVAAVLITYAIMSWLGFGLSSLSKHFNCDSTVRQLQGGQATMGSKVKLEAHIMSKCPDARDCLRDLVVPAMAQISDNVDFTLSYIGRLGGGDDNDPVQCMHGPSECLGNIIELCAANLHRDPKTYLGFTMCLSDDYAHIPQKELISQCALEHGIDFKELNDCASMEDGGFGMDLLKDSVTKSASANVTMSCTVRVDEEVRCIRDGGKWKDCPGGHSVDDLIGDIEKAAKWSQGKVS